MRVGIDCSCVAKAERTGVARYCSSLVREMPAVAADADRVDLLYRISRFRRRRWIERVEDPRFRVRWFQDWCSAIPLPFGPGGLDVVHGPDLRIPKVSRIPAVSTVHDLSALELPGIADAEFQRGKERALAETAARAAVILCISDYTRDTFLRRFPEAAPRTRVVPLGLSPRFAPQDPARVAALRAARDLRSPYLLFVGQVSARKNLLPLVEAFGRLHAADPALDLDLVLAGPIQTAGDLVVEAARKLPVAHRVRFLGFVGDDDLPTLYAGAEAFCFTGKGEGFGLPILEAMACRCPVIAVNAGANPGTAGDAGVIVDPDDAGEIQSAVLRLLRRGPDRDAVIERGVKWAARFSWRETARLTFQAYRDAVAAGAPR